MGIELNRLGLPESLTIENWLLCLRDNTDLGDNICLLKTYLFVSIWLWPTQIKCLNSSYETVSAPLNSRQINSVSAVENMTGSFNKNEKSWSQLKQSVFEIYLKNSLGMMSLQIELKSLINSNFSVSSLTNVWTWLGEFNLPTVAVVNCLNLVIVSSPYRAVNLLYSGSNPGMNYLKSYSLTTRSAVMALNRAIASYELRMAWSFYDCFAWS